MQALLEEAERRGVRIDRPLPMPRSGEEMAAEATAIDAAEETAAAPEAATGDAPEPPASCSGEAAGGVCGAATMQLAAALPAASGLDSLLDGGGGDSPGRAGNPVTLYRRSRPHGCGQFLSYHCRDQRCC